MKEWVRKQQDYLRTYSWRTGAWIWLRFRNPGKSKRQEARLNAMEQWKIRLTPQASTVPLTPYSLPLRISSGFLQVTHTPAQNTSLKIRSEVFVRFAADHNESSWQIQICPSLYYLPSADDHLDFSVQFPSGKWRVGGQ